MPAFIDLTGRTFSRLHVIERAPTPTGKRRRGYWRCICRCGTHCVVGSDNLRNGIARSCGCYSRDVARELLRTLSTRHRQAKTPTYNAWASMRQRCDNPRTKSYKHYGGRGIHVCPRWSDFANFFEDVGEKPTPKHSLERINHNGHYEPKNVKWATHQEQCNNRRNNVWVEYHGRRMTLTQAATSPLAAVSAPTVAHRVRDGWDLHVAVETPAMLSKEIAAAWHAQRQLLMLLLMFGR